MSSNTPTTLASRLKEVYPDGITALVPSTNELFGKRLEFRKDLVQGEKIRFDVQLSGEQGFSYGSGEVTLLGAIAQISEKAEVSGFTTWLQTNVSADAVSRAKSTKQAFAAFNSAKYIPAAESYRTRCELLCMGYGRQGVATVASVAGQVITIKPHTWCSAMLLTLKGSTIVAYTDTSTSPGTQHDGDMTFGAISITNKTITVVGTCSSVVENDILFLKGARLASAYGLKDIALNTGTLYNISATTHQLWAANAYDVGTSAITLGKVSLASAMAADKGCNEPLTLLVPNKAFQVMSNDLAGLREFGANYNKDRAETGWESIVMNGASGKITIVPYAFSMEGEAIMFPERFTYLLGSEEMSNEVFGTTGDIWFQLESVGSAQMRFFGDFTVFCEKPGYIVRLSRSDNLALHS